MSECREHIHSCCYWRATPAEWFIRSSSHEMPVKNFNVVLSDSAIRDYESCIKNRATTLQKRAILPIGGIETKPSIMTC